jgi:hypothetical protein
MLSGAYRTAVLPLVIRSSRDRQCGPLRQLAWTNVGNTKANYDDTSVWQHHVGSFTAPGRDQVMIYSLTGTQLATLNGITLSWETFDGASDYGDLTRMSPRWYADFTGTGKTSVLFHAPEDDRW